MKEVLGMMKLFNPYIYEPEKEISSTSLSSELVYSDNSSKESNQLENTRVGNHNWWNYGNSVSEKRETECLCFQDVHALNRKFDKEDNYCYWIEGLWNAM